MKKLALLSFLALTCFTQCKKNKDDQSVPVISSISPDNGVWSTIVTIRGNKFSATLTENQVQFNGVEAKVLTAASESLTVEVPKAAGTGPVTVTVKDRSGTGPLFTYTYITSVTTFAGSTAGATDATGTAAQFNQPNGVCVDSQGNVYVADLNNYRIRKITPAGVVSTLAGGTYGLAEGAGTAARFKSPWAICIDAQNNLYVSDLFNYRIRKITPAGVVSTLAGSTEGHADGAGTAAQFSAVVGLCIDAQGTLYAADESTHKIRKITPAGVVTTIAGSTAGYVDATGITAQFNNPRGICVDNTGNLYLADAQNNKIRKVTPAGVVTTLAGSTAGFADGIGTAARFSVPTGIVLAPDGDLYITELGNYKLRRITMTGQVTSFAGSTAGYADGSPAAAQFQMPYGICAQAPATFYVADRTNHRIRRITVE